MSTLRGRRTGHRRAASLVADDEEATLGSVLLIAALGIAATASVQHRTFAHPGRNGIASRQGRSELAHKGSCPYGQALNVPLRSTSDADHDDLGLGGRDFRVELLEAAHIPVGDTDDIDPADAATIVAATMSRGVAKRITDAMAQHPVGPGAKPAPAPVGMTDTIEDERLEAVRRYDVLDIPPDGTFDRITALLARLFNVPIAIVSVVDEDRIWFKSRQGLDVDETNRDPGRCASAIMQTDPWLVSDARADPRAMADPVVARDLGLQFYAGVPLASVEGHALGTLCIIDRAPRTLTPDELATLRDLAAIVVDELELRLASRRLSEQERALGDEQRRSAEDIASVTSTIRDLSDTEAADAVRPAICRIAMDLAQADSAAIHELSGDDMTLVQTLNVGAPWISADSSLLDLSSPAARAFVTGKALLIPEPEPEPRASEAPGDPATPLVTFWQPFAAGGRTSVAVLALSWERPLELSPVRLANLMEHLAAAAMAAFERADLLTQLEALARTDALTGLPNRRAINETLPSELARARREDRSLCVALLDIDHFKRFNDTYGHPAGDRLLVDAAATWREALRDGTDLLARYGGEEFLVVLPADTADAHATLERLRAAMPERQTASVGLALWDAEESADELVERADVALYAAKNAGRNRIEWAPAPTGGRH